MGPPVLDAIELGPRRVHTLRGPRQVGKSTTAKRLIRRLLDRGERRIFYWSFDLSTENADIVDAVRRARRLHPDPDGVWYLFLDEVTTVPDWQLGVKYLVDNGPSDDDCLLCTGSSARHVGSEQLPGRKGAGRHYLQLPVSFRDFCRDVLRLPLPDDTITPAQALTPAGMRVLKQLNLHGGALERAWGTYRPHRGLSGGTGRLSRARRGAGGHGGNALGHHRGRCSQRGPEPRGHAQAPRAGQPVPRCPVGLACARRGHGCDTADRPRLRPPTGGIVHAAGYLLRPRNRDRSVFRNTELRCFATAAVL